MVSIRRGPLPSSSSFSSASSSNGHQYLSHSESQALERKREGTSSFPSTFFTPLANHKPNNINNRIEYHHQHRFFSDINSKLKLTSWKRSLLVRRPVIILFFLIGFFFGIFTCLHDSISISDDHDFHPRHYIQSVSSSSSTSNNTNAAADKDNHDKLLLIKSTKKKKKLLIIVTPTYNRALQAYYLTRLSQTLKLVPPPFLWLVVEMNSASMETANLLRTSGVAAYRHLVCHKVSKDAKDRGVHQRNTALEHIERHRLDGIVFFADDDNIYTVQLFDELRAIKRFGTWPVAMLAQGKNKATLEGPVCSGGQVIGWHTNEKSKKLRRFHVDMSGFAFHSTILWDPHRYRRPSSVPIRQLDTVKEGFQETTFIEQVVEDEYQMEGIIHNCSVIMNWHIHLDAKHLKYPQGWHVSRNLDAVISLSSRS